MKATIICDNENGEDNRLKAGWEFACLIEAHGKKVLFDTGAKGDTLLSNMRELGINIKEIDFVFISHGHWDHAGGLAAFLNARGKLPVFVPAGFKKNCLEGAGEFEEVVSAKEICTGFFSTGSLGTEVKEQSLVIKSDGATEGNVVICGCSHPGLGAILGKASEFGEIHGVIGGFHGFEEFGILKSLNLISPCHCTKKKKEILELYPSTSAICKTGKVFLA